MWISANKLLPVLFALMMVSAAAATHYGGSSGSIGETDFAVPHFDSQEEILAELVAPFIFLTILLQFVLAKVLHFIIRDDDIPQGGVPRYPYADRNPNIKKYSTLMAVTITAILVPSPLWVYIRAAAGSIGVLSLGFFMIVLLMIFYKVLSN